MPRGWTNAHLRCFRGRWGPRGLQSSVEHMGAQTRPQALGAFSASLLQVALEELVAEGAPYHCKPTDGWPASTWRSWVHRRCGPNWRRRAPWRGRRRSPANPQPLLPCGQRSCPAHSLQHSLQHLVAPGAAPGGTFGSSVPSPAKWRPSRAQLAHQALRAQRLAHAPSMCKKMRPRAPKDHLAKLPPETSGSDASRRKVPGVLSRNKGVQSLRPTDAISAGPLDGPRVATVLPLLYAGKIARTRV